YVTRREFEAFKRHVFETGMSPSSQQLKQLKNETRVEYLKNMKPEVEKLIEQKDKARQQSKCELSR
ncbi:MAG: hypothetical protein IBJ00_07715, partial [Alphaproteobacteria bacterium]|nr:hypothetical protein [Alphaproteobacteria bacterium]